MSTQLTGPSLVAAGDLTLNTATPMEIVGTRIMTPGGREFAYCKVGATALVPGTLVQSAAESTGLENLTPTNTAIGATTVTTSSTLTATANEFAGGWLIVTVTPGQGYQYKIKSHPAASSAVCTFTLEDPIQVALTAAASKMDIVANPYSGVLINPSATSGLVVGVAVYPITALYYGWIQTKGPACILSDGGTTVGLAVSASNATPGAVETLSGTQAPVGIAITGVTTAEYGLFNINL
jgi:hypothetical protein